MAFDEESSDGPASIDAVGVVSRKMMTKKLYFRSLIEVLLLRVANNDTTDLDHFSSNGGN